MPEELRVPPIASLWELYSLGERGEWRGLLRWLGLEGRPRTFIEFESALKRALRERGITSIVEAAAARKPLFTPGDFAAAAAERGLRVPPASARNLLNLLVKLRLAKHVAGDLYTSVPPPAEAVAEYLKLRGGSLTVETLGKRLGCCDDAILKLWAEGRVEIEPKPGNPVKLDGAVRELVRLAGGSHIVDARLVERLGLKGHPRLYRLVGGEYMVVLHFDDRVKLREDRCGRPHSSAPQAPRSRLGAGGIHRPPPRSEGV